MTEPSPAPAASLFADLEPTPAAHFRVHLYGSILRLLLYLAERHETFEDVLKQHPFLTGYHDELATRLSGLAGGEAFDRWCQDLADWESTSTVHLPLRSVREAAGLGFAEVFWLMMVGLPDEDASFGELFESLQGIPGQRRPTFSLLRRCGHADPALDLSASLLARWRELGLLQVLNPEAARSDWALQIPAPLWDALAGNPQGIPEGFRFRRETDLPERDQLILPDELARAVQSLPELLRSGEIRALVVRGPAHNGRHALVGAVARASGRSVLEVDEGSRLDPERWRLLATLALATRALPVVTFDLGPGEVGTLPDGWLPELPLAVILGPHGGISGSLVASSLTLSLPTPGLAARELHWRRCLTPEEGDRAAIFASALRLGSGNLRRVARLARNRARLAGREALELADLVESARSLNREALDSLARPIPPGGDLEQLQVADSTWNELEHLEQRCRHRERLPDRLQGAPGGGPGCGVRALFTGPSGTGKTLAARLLAGRLGKDLYRLDLSAVVNKYIGETEKNLNRAFDRAEELDVVLLLDEGDALMTRRTDVQTSNDRYANLETNFLLQRLENYQGIVLITTNARERIDTAFERRMDVIVDFHLPDVEERLALWRLHLNSRSLVDEALLREVAARCQLTGGQIRNAALHATLLALDNGGSVTPAYLHAAVRREYVKQGAVSPLRHFIETH